MYFSNKGLNSDNVKQLEESELVCYGAIITDIVNKQRLFSTQSQYYLTF